MYALAALQRLALKYETLVRQLVLQIHVLEVLLILLLLIASKYLVQCATVMLGNLVAATNVVVYCVGRCCAPRSF